VIPAFTEKASRPASCPDEETVTFGIREVGDYINVGHRGSINGQKVLIRGGGCGRLFLADDRTEAEGQIQGT
jgi:hypothetical protein